MVTALTAEILTSQPRALRGSVPDPEVWQDNADL